MNYKIYEFPELLVKKVENSFFLEIPEKSDVSFEQKKLFNSILNFGYVPFEEGIFKITDKEIIDFWKYANFSLLKIFGEDFPLEKYFSFLRIAPPYTSQIPTIKEKETFISDSYQMTVAWVNDTETGKMASSPKAYKRDGLEIFNFEDEKIGSIFPEYFELYEIVDEANNSWKNWNKKERYDFAEKLKSLAEKRKIIIPDSLSAAESV